jgi:hypothetical protein
MISPVRKILIVAIICVIPLMLKAEPSVLRFYGDNDYYRSRIWRDFSGIYAFSVVDGELFTGGSFPKQTVDSQKPMKVLIFDFNPANYTPEAMIRNMERIDRLVYIDSPTFIYETMTDMGRTRVLRSDNNTLINSMQRIQSNRSQIPCYTSARSSSKLFEYYKTILMHLLLHENMWQNKMKLEVYVDDLSSFDENDYNNRISSFLSLLTGLSIDVQFISF